MSVVGIVGLRGRAYADIMDPPDSEKGDASHATPKQSGRSERRTASNLDLGAQQTQVSTKVNQVSAVSSSSRARE